MDKIALGNLPTPIQKMEQTSLLTGKQVYIKRDDLTGSELSGNKVRKLEYVLADALKKGCDTVITCGGIQSNHCRATAAACARLGLKCHLVLRGQPKELEGNYFLDLLLGAKFHLVAPGTDFDDALEERAKSLRAEGKKPYVIPLGASNALGARGYQDAYREILDWEREQKLRFDAICIAVGSAGSFAGLWLANRQIKQPKTLLGIAVSDNTAHFQRQTCRILSDMGAGLVREEEIHVIDSYIGLGYALATREEMEQYKWLARNEGIVLDPCYTGKAFIGMLAEIKSGMLRNHERILFIHTGGLMGWTAQHRRLALEGAES